MLLVLKMLIFMLVFVLWFGPTCWTIGFLENLSGRQSEQYRWITVAGALWPVAIPLAAIGTYIYYVANTFGVRGAQSGARVRVSVEEAISDRT